MGREKKITRHTIAASEPPPFHFIGVVSAEPDYRLSVMINRRLGSDLTRSDDEIKPGTAGGSSSFARFTTGEGAFTLISNRSAGKTLIRKLRNIDFFVVINEKSSRLEIEELARSLRGIPEITALFVLHSRDTADPNLPLLIT